MADMREGVRRRLFQDDDSPGTGGGGGGGGVGGRGSESGEGENITNSLLEQIKLEQEAARTRWNFDFDKEQPLPGRWEWVKKGESRFEHMGEEEPDEFFLARDQLDTDSNVNPDVSDNRPPATTEDSNQSNDVFLDANASPAPSPSPSPSLRPRGRGDGQAPEAPCQRSPLQDGQTSSGPLR